MTHDVTETLSRTGGLRRDEMLEPDEVSTALRLKALGWGARRIAVELGCSRTTVRRWLKEGTWHRPALPARPKVLDGLEAWIENRFRRHAGNADVVRQELAVEKGIVVGLRTVERAVAHLRQELRAEARATVRLRDAPGASSCRSTSGNDGWRSTASRGRCRSSWRRWATRGASTCARSWASARSTGLRGWRARSWRSVACPRRCCSTTPGR